MTRLYITLAAVVFASASANAGICLYGNSPSDAALVSIPLDGSGSLSEIFSDDEYMIANGGAVYADGKYYVNYNDSFNPYIVYGSLTPFAFDGETVSRGNPCVLYDEDMFVAADLTYDPISKKVYGAYRYFEDSTTDTHFGTLDPAKGKWTAISDGGNWYSLAADSDGQIYGIDTAGSLYRIDKTDGSSVLVGATGITPSDMGSATIDPASHRCFWSAYSDSAGGALYEVNLQTGAATLLYSYPGSQAITGLFTLTTADTAVPSAPQNLRLDFAENALTGQVCFTVPATLSDGSQGSGNASYTISANGSLLTQGEAQFGSEVTAEVTLPEPGEYTFSVVLANDGGMGEEASLTQWIGTDSRNTLTPPFTQTFTGDNALDGYFIIDANGDGKTWGLYNGRVRVTYNDMRDMDDWLISPPVELSAGVKYPFTAHLSTVNTSSERFEVRLGAGHTAADMTTVIIEPTEFQSEGSDPDEFRGYIHVTKSGKYHIGIHGMSDMDHNSLYLHDFSIGEGADIAAPAQPTLTVKPDVNFGLSAEISVTAPEKTISGDDLPYIMEMSVVRDGEYIHTIDNPTPGQTYTFIDTEGMTAGKHRYSAFAVNQTGFGEVAIVDTYVGVSVPSAPANADFRQTQPGEVTITWDAPTTDTFGHDINPELLRYNIQVYVDNRAQLYTIAENVEGTSYTYRVCDADAEQDIYYYAVSAVTSAGESDNALTDIKPVGKPYELPFRESFADGRPSHNFGIKRLEGFGCTWSVGYGDNAQDGDGGFMQMTATEPGSKSRISSGNIVLPKDSRPELTLYYFSAGEDCLNTLEVLADSGDGYKSLRTVTLTGTTDWHELKVPFDALAGQTVSFALIGGIVTHTPLPVDNISLTDLNGGVDLMPAEGNAMVAVSDGTIYVELLQPADVAVYALDGKAIYSQHVDHTAHIAAAPGIYILRAGNTTRRIIVK